MVANCVARTPGRSARFTTRPLDGARCDAAFEVEFRTAEVGFGLDDLRFGLLLRGIGGEEFAFEIAEVALRLLEVGPLSGPSRGECGELLDALFRQVDPRGQRGFLATALLS